MRHAHALPFGAELLCDGRTGFRIWAPSVEHLALEIDGQSPTPMCAEPDGWFALDLRCRPGTPYRYVLPNGLRVPDPASRLQHGDVHGCSVVVDPQAYEWQVDDWLGRPWHETVIYECHAGLMGGFAGIASQLERLHDIGFSAIELMPIADFPGRHNWGYDGVLLFAPDEAYGTPHDLKALIDRAHALGLMVFLDVVYNHFGPDGNYLHAYARPFFDDDVQTPWGAAIAFKRPQVAQFFIHNALYWLNEYRFDGLRFDATHAIAPQTFLNQMAHAIRSVAGPRRHVHLVLEHEGNRASLLTDTLYDAQWADDLHHCVHVLLTGEQEGYYADYPDPAALLARCLHQGFAYQGQASPRGHRRGEPSSELPPTRFVICLQNHDQIGNRAMGERLAQLADLEALLAAQALLLLTPQVPLLFMGEEYASRAPFLFFADHNAELAKLVRDGRRREFAHFAAFTDEARRAKIPDPNDPHTFERSRPDPTEADPETERQTRKLLSLRARAIIPRLPGCRSLGAGAVGGTGVLARWIMGDGAELVLACNLGETGLPIEAVGGDILFESHTGDADALAAGQLRPRATIALLLART